MKHRILAFPLYFLPLLCGTLYAQTTLQSVEVKNVNGAADVVVNATLPPAPPVAATFNLSGPITGTAAYFLGVTAQTTDGLSAFSGSVDFFTNNYLVKVPAGTYKLSVSYIASLTGASTISTYNDPAPVQVTADTVHPIVVVPAVLHAVSGTVSILDPRFPSTAMIFVPTNSNSSFSVNLAKLNGDGTYSGSLSDGAYAVLLVLSTKDSSRTTSLNLGSLTVSGADVSANYTLPALSNLSGTVQTADGTPIPNGSTVIGIEGNLSLIQNTTTFPLFAFGTATIDNASGLYQVVLASGRQYTLAVSLDVLAQDLLQSSGTFSLLLSNTIQLAGDVTQNITLPRLPGTVTISGQVRDNTGAPLSNATVDANTAEVAGVSLGYFSRSTQTDASGNYRLVVLSGTNYDLLFTAPLASVAGSFQVNGSKPGSTEWVKKIRSAISR